MMRVNAYWHRLRRRLEGARRPRVGGALRTTAVWEADAASAAPLPSPEEMRAALRRTRKAAALRLFNPAQPVEDRHQLLGREEELEQLSRTVLELGMHALVHGARGAGKTSLVRAFGDHADEQGHIVLYASCSDDCSFAELFSLYLDELAEALPRDLAQVLREGRRAAGEAFGPRALAALLTRIDGHQVVMIVDEFDRLANPATRAAVATLLKLLSDARASVRLLIVGIAPDMAGLIDSHASLRRHVAAVRLRPFDDRSAADLFARGQQATGISFGAEARARIASLAMGSPYHLRLFCYTTMSAAIERDEELISAASLEAGLRDAFGLWAASNPAAATLFQRLARTGFRQRDSLCALAIAMLATDPLAPPAASAPSRDPAPAEVFGLLAPVLASAEEGRAPLFEDSLAPQFLLVACHLAGRGDASSRDEPRAVLSPFHPLHEVRP